MTDDDEAPDDNPTDASSADAPVTTADRMLALQRADTEIDQLLHRRERLSARDVLASATDELRQWEADRSAMRSRMDELTAVIERCENETADITSHRERLEAQMKTVIAPREAEALMNEMATLDEQRDAVETTELEALEEQSAIDDRLSAHLARESGLRDSMASADDALALAVGEIDAEVAEVTSRRDALRHDVSSELQGRYDRLRSTSGVAVAALIGHRCDGCHLDLSAAEVDDVKDDANAHDGIADCPQCGRMLIV